MIMMLTMMLMMIIMMLLMMMMTTVMMMMLIGQEWPQEASRDPFFLPFPSPSQKITPGSLQKPSFTHFRARPRKWSQEPCRGPFLAISELKLGNGPRKHTEAQFYPFPSPSEEMAPGSLQRLIFVPFPSPSQEMTPQPSFTHFRAHARKVPQETSRDPFLPISESRPGNGPRKPPEVHFLPFPSPSQEIVPGRRIRIRISRT